MCHIFGINLILHPEHFKFSRSSYCTTLYFILISHNPLVMQSSTSFTFSDRDSPSSDTSIVTPSRHLGSQGPHTSKFFLNDYHINSQPQFSQSNRDRIFSSPIKVPTHHNRNFGSRSSSALSTPKRGKRRNSDSDEGFKRTKQASLFHKQVNNGLPKENLTMQNIDLDEYPKFKHPNGGIIQFTPIGNIRTFADGENVVQRVIEKDSSFDLSKTDCGIDGYALFFGSHGFEDDATTSLPKYQKSCLKGVPLDNSPSNEIEEYMRNGYTMGSSPSTSSYYENGTSSSAKLSFFLNDDDYDDDDDDDDAIMD